MASLEKIIKLYGKKSIVTAKAYAWVSHTHLALGEYEKSEEYFEKAVDTVEEFCGAKSPIMANLYFGHGLMWLNKQHPGNALKYFERVDEVDDDDSLDYKG
mmetsp:Transcript_26941/g.23805  ORF Transcript_26941/g.23805 Transcript_26941/m.23805 type:complete len:101 (+) Transcript_26941:1923-2225(+)